MEVRVLSTAHMKSRRYKIIFSIRFFGYIIFFTGLISFFAVLGPLTKAEFNYRWDQFRGVKRTIPKIITSNSQNGQLGTPADASNLSSFGQLQANVEVITPVSTEFGIVIEKINANARVIDNVSPTNYKEYVQALTQGVAHAHGSNYPGEKGNTYLFSHSTDAPWNIVRYNAIFYLLRELESGDRVIVFYKNRRYDYIIFDKIVVSPTDVKYLTEKYEIPVLTLQTCDPPGTLLNRLIVRAKLEGS